MTTTRFDHAARAAMESGALVPYLQRQRWFGGKARPVRRAVFADWAELNGASPIWITLVDVHYDDGIERYHLPLTRLAGEAARRALAEHADAVLASSDEPVEVLADASVDADACRRIFALMRQAGEFPSQTGVIRAIAAPDVALAPGSELAVTKLPGLHSNTSITIADAWVLKLLRRIEFGLNPDVEIGRFLARHGGVNVPRLEGSLDYARDGDIATLALVQALVPSRTSGWDQALSSLAGFFARVPEGGGPPESGFDGVATPYATHATTLGRRTAELHVALASDENDPAFVPQSASASDVVAWADRMSAELGASLDLLAQRQSTLDTETAALAAQVLDTREELRARLQSLGRQIGKLPTIRVHGDYHLGQVLVLQDDFVILDFEGEPARTLDERRARQPVLRDIAGMVRSFSYAAEHAAAQAAGGDAARAAQLDVWAGRWAARMSAAFLSGYTATASARPLLPQDPSRLHAGLALFVLDKAAYELRYELNNRPDWVRVPLKGLLSTDVLELPSA